MAQPNNFIQLLPGALQTDTTRKIFRETVENVFSANNAENIAFYVGKKPERYYDRRVDFYENLIPPTRRYEFGPAFVSRGIDAERNIRVNLRASLSDVLDRFNLQGVIHANSKPGRVFYEDFYSFCPPIDVDKLLNFSNYVWLPEGPPAQTIDFLNFGPEQFLQSINDGVVTLPNGEQIVLVDGMRFRFLQSPTVSQNGRIYLLSSPKDRPLFVDDTENEGSTFSEPLRPTIDYITIARGAKNNNPWSKSNRWFHISLLGNKPLVDPTFQRAKRPIIEFCRWVDLYSFGKNYRGEVDAVYDGENINLLAGMPSATIDGVSVFDGFRVLVLGNDISEERRHQIFRIDGISSLGGIVLIEEAPSNIGDNVFVKSRQQYWHYDKNALAWIVSQDRTLTNRIPRLALYNINGVELDSLTEYPFGTDYQGSFGFGFELSVDAPIDPYINMRVVLNKYDDPRFVNYLESRRYYYISEESGRPTEIQGQYYVRSIEDGSFHDFWNKAPKALDVRLTQQIEVFSTIDPTSLKETAFLSYDLEMPEEFFRYYRQDITRTKDIKITFQERRLSLGTDYQIYDLSTASKNRLSVVFSENLGLVTGNIINIEHPDLLDLEIYPNEFSRFNFERPLSFDRNPLNETPVYFYMNEVVPHFSSILEQQDGFVGSAFGENNSRFLKIDRGRGRFMLRHSATPALPAILNADAENRLDVLSSLQFVGREYDLYLRRFRQELDNLYGTMAPQDKPLSAQDYLDRVLDILAAGGNPLSPFFNTRMAGTREKFIPPSPAHLGISPLYEPKIFFDETLVDPRYRLLCHDGRIEELYEIGDLRNEVLFLFESLVYCAASSKKSLINIFDFLPMPRGYVKGPYRTTLDEWRSLIGASFNPWVWNNQISVDGNPFYDPSDWRTWNYSNLFFKDENGNNVENLPGHWRGVFLYLYGTDRPATNPWEILGYSQKPAWFDEEYGTNYGRLNTKLWEDLASGFDRGLGKIKIGYERPFLLRYIPTDEYGVGLTLPQILGETPDPALAAEGFSVGDMGPVEYSWWHSSAASWARLEMMYRFSPVSVLTLLWDIDKVDVVFDKISHISGRPYRPFDKTQVRVHNLPIDKEKSTSTSEDDFVFVNGLLHIIVCHARAMGQNEYTVELALDNIDTRLVWESGRFIEESSLRVVADNLGPLVKDDFMVSQRVATPFDIATYSALAVVKTTRGYSFSGFDGRTRKIPFYKPLVDRYKTKTFSGRPAPFFEWEPDIVYRQGQIVRHLGAFYSCAARHTSTQFQQDFESGRWIRLAELPILGGVPIRIYDSFESRVSFVEYGKVFPTLQDIIDIIQGYQKFLLDRGWKFQINEDGAPEDFVSAIPGLVSWDSSNPVDEAYVISPLALVGEFVSSGHVARFDRPLYGLANVLDSRGQTYPVKNLFIERDSGSIKLSVRDQSSANGLYLMRFLTTYHEHVVEVRNFTQFGDVINDRVLGIYQPRLKIFANASPRIGGPKHAGGHIVSGDVMVPNPERLVSDFESFYDGDRQIFSGTFFESSRGTVAWRNRDYMSSLLMDRRDQFQMHQKIASQKGTLQSLGVLGRNTYLLDVPGYTIHEDWMARLSFYSAEEKLDTIEARLERDDIRSNRQLLKFVPGTEPSGVGIDNILYIPVPEDFFKTESAADEKSRLLLGSLDLLPSPFVVSQNNSFIFKTAGFPMVGDASVKVPTSDNITNTFSNINFTEKDRVWLGIDRRRADDWDFYRPVKVGTIDRIEFDISTYRARIHCRELNTRNIVGRRLLVIGIDVGNKEISSFLTVLSVDNQNSIITALVEEQGLDRNFDQRVSEDDTLELFVLESLRFRSQVEVVNYTYPFGQFEASELLFLDGWATNIPDGFQEEQPFLGPVIPAVRSGRLAGNVPANNVPVPVVNGPPLLPEQYPSLGPITRFSAIPHDYVSPVTISLNPRRGEQVVRVVVEFLSDAPADLKVFFTDGAGQSFASTQHTYDSLSKTLIFYASNFSSYDEFLTRIRHVSISNFPLYGFTSNVRAVVSYVYSDFTDTQEIEIQKNEIGNDTDVVFVYDRSPSSSTNHFLIVLLEPFSTPQYPIEVPLSEYDAQQAVAIEFSSPLPPGVSFTGTNSSYDPIANRFVILRSSFSTAEEFRNALRNSLMFNTPPGFFGEVRGRVYSIKNNIQGPATTFRWRVNENYVVPEAHVPSPIVLIANEFPRTIAFPIVVSDIRLRNPNVVDSVSIALSSSENLAQVSFNTGTRVGNVVTIRRTDYTSDVLFFQALRNFQIVLPALFSASIETTVTVETNSGNSSVATSILVQPNPAAAGINIGNYSVPTAESLVIPYPVRIAEIGIGENPIDVSLQFTPALSGNPIFSCGTYNSNTGTLRVIASEFPTISSFRQALSSLTIGMSQPTAQQHAVLATYRTTSQTATAQRTITIQPAQVDASISIQAVEARQSATRVRFQYSILARIFDQFGLENPRRVVLEFGNQGFPSNVSFSAGTFDHSQQRLVIERSSYTTDQEFFEALDLLVIEVPSPFSGAVPVSARFETSDGITPPAQGAIHILTTLPEIYDLEERWRVITPNLTVLRVEGEKVQPDSLLSSLIYDKEKQRLLTDVVIFNPLLGRHAPDAMSQIDYVTPTDPARYANSFQEDFPVERWGEEQIGTIWWNIRDLRYYWYDQADDFYRCEMWGRTFPQLGIRILQWIKSPVPPADFVQYVKSRTDTPFSEETVPFSLKNFVVENKFDAELNTTRPVYYFWVENNEYVYRGTEKTPPSLSIASISRILTQPGQEGLPWISPVSRSTLLFSEVERILTASTVLQLTFLKNNLDGTRRSHWTFVAPNDEPPHEYIVSKFRDSISSLDKAGNVVPDFNMPPALLYGNLERPRQSWFSDLGSARRVAVEYLNQFYADADLPIFERDANWRSFFYLEEPVPLREEPVVKEPNAIYRFPQRWFSYKETVQDLQDLVRLSSEQPIEEGTLVLVLNDSSQDGRWSVYARTDFEDGRSLNAWSLHATQILRIPDFWNFVDWFNVKEIQRLIERREPYRRKLDDFANFTASVRNNLIELKQNIRTFLFLSILRPDKTYPTLEERNRAVLSEEDKANLPLIVRVDDMGNSDWALFSIDSLDSLGNPVWKIIGQQNGTIQFNKKLYDFMNAQEPDATYLPVAVPRAWQELIDYFFRTEKNKDKNRFLIEIFAEVKRQFPVVDWLVKSSTIFVDDVRTKLREDALARPETFPFLEKFINEFKPYHTKIRGAAEIKAPQAEDLRINIEEIRNFDITMSFDRVSAQVDQQLLDQHAQAVSDSRNYLLTPQQRENARLLRMELEDKFTAAERIVRFTQGSLKKDLALQYKGVDVDGNEFDTSLLHAIGYDRSPYDSSLGYDFFLDQQMQLYNGLINNISVTLSGPIAENFRSSLGLTDLDIDAGSFANPIHKSDNPEELAMVNFVTGFNMEVFTVNNVGDVTVPDNPPWITEEGITSFAAHHIETNGPLSGNSAFVVPVAFDVSVAAVDVFYNGMLVLPNVYSFVQHDQELIISFEDHPDYYQNFPLLPETQHVTIVVRNSLLGAVEIAETVFVEAPGQNIFQISRDVQAEDRLIVFYRGVAIESETVLTNVSLLSNEFRVFLDLQVGESLVAVLIRGGIDNPRTRQSVDVFFAQGNQVSIATQPGIVPDPEINNSFVEVSMFGGQTSNRRVSELDVQNFSQVISRIVAQLQGRPDLFVSSTFDSISNEYVIILTAAQTALPINISVAYDYPNITHSITDVVLPDVNISAISEIRFQSSDQFSFPSNPFFIRVLVGVGQPAIDGARVFVGASVIGPYANYGRRLLPKYTYHYDLQTERSVFPIAPRGFIDFSTTYTSLGALNLPPGETPYRGVSVIVDGVRLPDSEFTVDVDSATITTVSPVPVGSTVTLQFSGAEEFEITDTDIFLYERTVKQFYDENGNVLYEKYYLRPGEIVEVPVLGTFTFSLPTTSVFGIPVGNGLAPWIIFSSNTMSLAAVDTPVSGAVFSYGAHSFTPPTDWSPRQWANWINENSTTIGFIVELAVVDVFGSVRPRLRQIFNYGSRIDLTSFFADVFGFVSGSYVSAGDQIAAVLGREVGFVPSPNGYVPRITVFPTIDGFVFVDRRPFYQNVGSRSRVLIESVVSQNNKKIRTFVYPGWRLAQYGVVAPDFAQDHLDVHVVSSILDRNIQIVKDFPRDKILDVLGGMRADNMRDYISQDASNGYANYNYDSWGYSGLFGIAFKR